MRETSKSHPFRVARGDFDLYLRGDGIDIGAGPDVLKISNGTVRPWDLADGDAQLMASVADATFDFVYSSHCLEHMRDVPEALRNWTRILKTNGFLYIVVPDYVHYEKMTWPSRFNPDHKQSFCFTVARDEVRRPNHWHIQNDLVPLLTQLNMHPERITFEGVGFNYNAGIYDQTLQGALAQLCIVAKKLPGSTA